MTYNKPDNLKYTDMAIYIDANIDKILEAGKNPDVESTIFQYIYFICYVLACKKKFFHNFEDYDYYSLYAAGQIFLLLRNKYNRGKSPNEISKPIKSSLNYIKSVLYPFKVNYQKQNFQEIIKPEIHKDIDVEGIASKLRDSVQADYNYDMQESLMFVFKQLPQIIKKVVNETPYTKDKIMIKNLYFSCLLSLINNITLPNQTLKNKRANKEIRLIENQNNYEDYILLWHLEKTMHDYIKLLVNKIKILFTHEFEEVKNSFTLDENTINDILDSAYADYDTNKNNLDIGGE